MTPEIEKKRRELFEAWAVRRRDPSTGLPFFVMINPQGLYIDGTTRLAWEGFNAALDEVEIEIDRGNMANDYMSSTEVVSVEGVLASINATGLGLRIK